MNKTLRYQQGTFEIPQLETVPESVHQSVLGALETIQKKEEKAVMHGNAHLSRRVLLPLAATLVLMTGMSVFAVSLYEQRMKNINQQKLEEYYLQIQTARVDSFHYNRPLTETERSRFDTLNQSYEEEGMFPKGALTVLESPEAHKGKGVGFYETRSTFFLPEQELTDEELLQLIDFYHQVNYSLQKVGGQIKQGVIQEPESENSGLEQSVAPGKERPSVLAYEGDLSIHCMTAGADSIYLEGWDGIEKMEIGSSVSAPFFADYDRAKGDTSLQPYIFDMVETPEGELYVAVVLWDGTEGKTGQIWHLDADGNYLNTLELGDKKPRKLAVDARGNLYVRLGSRQQDGTILYVYDGQGAFLTKITSDHDFHVANGICRGKDGKVYMLFEDFDRQTVTTNTGILRIDLEEKQAVVAAQHFLPDHGAAYDVLAPGGDSDFVILGMDGIYTYDLQDEESQLRLASYDAPCSFEGCKAAVLPDGRMLLAKPTEYTEVTVDGKPQYRWKAEGTCFYFIEN